MLESGKKKLQQICDVLKKETIEPSKVEAQNIINKAQVEAQEILVAAQKQAEEMHQRARVDIERERNVFLSSLTQASRQSIDALKLEIEQKLFNQDLFKLVHDELVEPNVMAKIITSLVQAIDKEGLRADLSAAISSSVSPKEVNVLLAKEILDKLKGGVSLESFSGGVQLQLKDKNITIDLTDKALVDLLQRYLRKDFRKWLFG